MKVDDIINIDQASPKLDPHLVQALNIFGFVTVTYSLYHRSTNPPPYVGIIAGIRNDGTGHSWTGTGDTPEEAETDAIDALAKWILSQPIPPGATP